MVHYFLSVLTFERYNVIIIKTIISFNMRRVIRAIDLKYDHFEGRMLLK